MPPPLPRLHGRLLVFLAILALGLTGVATLSAFSTLGMKFPSRVVDAYGIYSIVELPLWDPLDRTPALDRLVSVNGEPLPEGPPPQALTGLYELLKDQPIGSLVALRFEGPKETYLVHSRLRAFGAEELVFFFVTYALAGWVVLWSGALVFIACSRPAARRAYTFWSISAFLFLIAFYDHHTRAWLFPAFSLSTVGILLGALWLAYAFPKTPQRNVATTRGVLTVLTLVGAVAAVGLIVTPVLGGNTLPIRRAIDWLMGPGLAILALAVVLRLRRSHGLDRRDLVTAAWGLVTTPLLIAIFHTLRMLTGRDSMHLVMPFIVLIFPLSIGYALIRNNLLESQLVITRWLVRIPFALGALLVAVLSTYLLYLSVRGDHAVPLLLILLGLAIFVLVMRLAERLQVRLFFPSTLAFRGTVGRLKDQLASLRDIPAIQKAVEDAVAQALPTRSAQVLTPQASSALPEVSPDAREKLTRGENVWTEQRPRDQHLLVPMRSQGELRAILSVAPRHETALYTREDLDLLETLASLGALALHNAAAVQELDSLRRLEVGAARDDKRLALSALGTELCHEMVYPLNFLRDLLRRGASGRPLDGEDLSFARMEVDRMDRMIHSLRELELPPPQVASLQLLDPVHRALLLLREPIEEKKLALSIEVPPQITVQAEADTLIQLLSNLLRNAAQSTPEGGAIGVQYRDDPTAPSLEIWDTGPGIPEAIASILFTRRVSTKAQGHGIGLTVVERIARSFRWQVSFRREADRTFFRLTLPPHSEPARYE